MPEAKTDQRAAPPRFEELLARAEALIPVLRERARETRPDVETFMESFQLLK